MLNYDGPFMYNPNRIDIKTMDSGEKRLFLGMKLIPSRFRYGVPQDFRWDYENDIPIKYICDFGKWLDEKELGGYGQKLLESIKSNVRAILLLDGFDETFKGCFRPDEKTGITRDSKGNTHIIRKKGFGDYGKEDCEIIISPKDWQLLLSEAKSTI